MTVTWPDPTYPGEVPKRDFTDPVGLVAGRDRGERPSGAVALQCPASRSRPSGGAAAHREPLVPATRSLRSPAQ